MGIDGFCTIAKQPPSVSNRVPRRLRVALRLPGTMERPATTVHLMAGASGTDVMRAAGWLPEQGHLERWLDDHRRRSADTSSADAHPVIGDFRQLIQHDPIVRMAVEQMVEQVPAGKRYQNRPVTSVDELLAMLDAVLTRAPEFGDEMAATPMAAILDWSMGTTAGLAAFRDARINGMMRKILAVWCDFLSSPASLSVLNDSDHGWKSERAQHVLGMDQYVHDPDDEHWGFTSWNDFFTRRFKAGQRPIADPDDDAVIVNACESTPYALKTQVQRTDRFWLKQQPYSLHDLLAGDDSVDRFVGGTVYQAFLSADDYHRWHSPVTGTIRRATLQPGTYFSQAASEGPDAIEPTDSQGYLAHVAARAIFIIEADHPGLGLVAFVPVGMVEVSSCLIADGIAPGTHVSKGDELGRFQFGGSTHCIVLEPGAVAQFDLDALPGPDAALKQVNTRLATSR